MSNNFDVVVIGGGIVGRSSAFALASASRDLKVALVSPLEELASASSAAGAMLGVYGESTAFGLRCNEGRAKHQLSVTASEMWPEWVSQVATRAERAETDIGRGTFLVLNHLSSRLDEANFDAAISLARMEGAPCDTIDPSEIEAFRPLDFGRAARAVYLADEGWVSASVPRLT